MDMMQPGQVVAPQGADEPQQPKEPDTPRPGAPKPVPVVHPPAQPDGEPEPAPAPSPGPEPVAYGSDDVDDLRSASHAGSISWTASEFIAHEKSFGWYGATVLGGIVAAGLDYWLTKDGISAAVILFAAVAFAAISARRPRTQQYTLTYEGLQIGGKIYYFHDFKNFSVTEEGAIAGVVFMPLKRFMPSLTIYVAPDMEDQVFDFLSEILPFEQSRADAVDGLMRRIRF